MPDQSPQNTGHGNIRIIAVWDPLVRLIHWSLAVTILLNGFFTDPEGRGHEIVGYVALGMVAVRLIWGLIGPEPARLWAFPPSPWRAVRYLRAIRAGDRTIHLSHNPLGALMVWNIWATVTALGATGIMMGTPRFFGVGWIESAHEMLFNWLIFSVALHVGGVFFDTRRSKVPLIRAMIDGRKRVPSDAHIE